MIAPVGRRQVAHGLAIGTAGVLAGVVAVVAGQYGLIGLGAVGLLALGIVALAIFWSQLRPFLPGALGGGAASETAPPTVAHDSLGGAEDPSAPPAIGRLLSAALLAVAAMAAGVLAVLAAMLGMKGSLLLVMVLAGTAAVVIYRRELGLLLFGWGRDANTPDWARKPLLGTPSWQPPESLSTPLTVLLALGAVVGAGTIAWLAASLGMKGPILLVGLVALVAFLLFVRPRADALLFILPCSLILFLHKSFTSQEIVNSGAPSIYVTSTGLLLVVLYGVWAAEGTLRADLRRAFRRPVLWIPMVGFALMLPSLMVATNLALSVAEFVRMLWMYLLFVFVAVRVRRQTQMLLMLAGLAVFSCVEFVVVVLQWKTGGVLGLSFLGVPTQLGERVINDGSIGRPFGTIVHPVFLGAAMGALGLLFLGIAVSIEERWLKRAALALVPICFIPLLLAHSRAATMAFAPVALCVVIAGAVQGRISRRSIKLMALAFVVAAVVGYPFWSEQVSQEFGSDHFSLEVESRVQLNDFGFRMTDDHPVVGVGLNNFQTVEPRYDNYGALFAGNPVHNLYLLQASETGYLGLAGLLLVGGAVFLVAGRLARVRDPLLGGVGLGVTAVVAFFALEELLGFSLREEIPLALWWVMAGMAVAGSAMVAEREHRQRVARRPIGEGDGDADLVLIGVGPNDPTEPIYGSNGHGTNGHGTNGHGTNGNGSNGHGTNGNGSNGHGTNGNGSNGHGTHGLGSNGHGTNGNGNGTNGHGSNGHGIGGDGLHRTRTDTVEWSRNGWELFGLDAGRPGAPSWTRSRIDTFVQWRARLVRSGANRLTTARHFAEGVLHGVVAGARWAFAGRVVIRSRPRDLSVPMTDGARNAEWSRNGWDLFGMDAGRRSDAWPGPAWATPVRPTRTHAGAIVAVVLLGLVAMPWQTGASAAANSLAGVRIVFAATDKAESGPAGVHALYTADGDGSNIVRITPADGASYDFPTWAMNGTKIVYSKRVGGPGSPENIFLMNPDGSGVQQLTTSPWRNHQPKVSRDGRTVLFSGFVPGTRLVALYQLDLETLLVQNLSAVHSHSVMADADPKYTADGQSIAFARSRDDQGDAKTQVYLMNADGTGRYRVTQDDYYDVDPMVSPDGGTVAYSSFRGDGTPQQEGLEGQAKAQDFFLAVRDLRTGAERTLTGGANCALRLRNNPCKPNEGSAYVPVWSPSGGQIGYVTALDRNRTCICVMDRDGTHARAVIAKPGLSTTWFDWVVPGPAPSTAVTDIGGAKPADRMLVAGTHTASETDDTSRPMLEVTTPDLWNRVEGQFPAFLSPRFARWSANRSTMVFSSVVPGPVPKASPIPVPPPGQKRHEHFTLSQLSPAFHPDVIRPDVAHEQVFVSGPHGVFPLTDPGTEDWHDGIGEGDLRGNTEPDISPDGRYVVFTNVSSTTNESFILRIDLVTGEIFNLTNATSGAMPVADASPRYSPDGQTITFTSSFEGHFGVYVMDAATGLGVHTLTDDDYFNTQPTWSPDGQSIVYASYRGDLPTLLTSLSLPEELRTIPLTDWYLVRVDVATGAKQVLTAPEASPTLAPAWSPDGSQIAFISTTDAFQPDVYVVPATGGAVRPLQITGLDQELSVDWK